MATSASLSRELIRAATEISNVRSAERARLVKEAADAIIYWHTQIAYAGKPKGLSPKVSTFTLRLMSLSITRHKDSAVAEAMLDAAKLIRDLRLMLGSRDTSGSSGVIGKLIQPQVSPLGPDGGRSVASFEVV